MTILLKNMFTKSCVKQVSYAVRSVAPQMRFEAFLGKIVFEEPLATPLKKEIIAVLNEHGFPSIDNPDQAMVEAIKLAAFELIFLAMNSNSLVRNSDYISDKLLQPYDKLSRIFTKETGTNLEKYLIALKIEKIKELIDKNENSLSEIAFNMGYSSVQYLSNQFKKITGKTITNYKYDGLPPRVSIEQILEEKQYKIFFYRNT